MHGKVVKCLIRYALVDGCGRDASDFRHAEGDTRFGNKLLLHA